MGLLVDRVFMNIYLEGGNDGVWVYVYLILSMYCEY